ncbi:MAG: hypothetical protein J6R86_09235, partial [Lentisphaeria bacterium]|nr:hypothetical protein [Lentisphaeria bacterium]
QPTNVLQLSFILAEQKKIESAYITKLLYIQYRRNLFLSTAEALFFRFFTPFDNEIENIPTSGRETMAVYFQILICRQFKPE